MAGGVLTMPRYIDADKIPYQHYAHNELWANKDDIDRLSTISPNVVRGVGEWMPAETELGFSCSVCGKLLDEYVHGGEWVSLAKMPNYCPNCGARLGNGGTDDS